jgi:molecular chaperone HtpG
MSEERGNLSINSDNILPIIKKWLYSDTDIFVRELVSNGTDAITKLKKLVDMGEAAHISEDEKYAIQVTVDKANKLIVFSDNGIGMTADEIKQYINQIAFSGANDFVQKYSDKMDKDNEIIGHFGLGFYSAFMVAEKVEIDSLSYTEGAVPAKWTCDGGIEFVMEDGTRTTRGTTITLFVGEDGIPFLDEYKLKSTLTKYCGFIPVDIFFEAIKEEKPEEESKIEEEVSDENEIVVTEPKPINDTKPLWAKQPSECTDEEYKEFYHKVFTDFNEPLFWIHLNMDYPFRLKGILYFPKLKHELESIEGQVKLYNNQVYIADNIKEVIPEFLLLLKGALDCPDLPLNVSRSFLQNDGYVAKMSSYISKKVADKLNSLFKKDRDNFNTYWDDISPFIKYGCIKEKNFYDKIKESILFKTTKGDYVTLAEYLERNKEKNENKVFYVSNEQQQAQYIKLFKDQEMEAVILTTNLDNPFISYLESYETGTTFARIDSDISSNLKEVTEKDENDTTNDDLQNIFRKALNMETLKVQAESLKTDSVSAMILLSEQSRRMQEMSKMFGGMNMGTDMFQNEETLVLNKNNNLIKIILENKGNEAKQDTIDLICQQVYDIAMISHKPLEVDAMTKFIERSNKILEMVSNK